MPNNKYSTVVVSSYKINTYCHHVSLPLRQTSNRNNFRNRPQSVTTRTVGQPLTQLKTTTTDRITTRIILAYAHSSLPRERSPPRETDPNPVQILDTFTEGGRWRPSRLVNKAKHSSL